jgi:hypothetical protein
MAGNQAIPLHCDDLLEPVLNVGEIGICHSAVGHGFQRNPVDRKNDLLLRQAHHQCAVRVVPAELDPFERGTPEPDGPTAVDRRRPGRGDRVFNVAS